MAVTIAAAIFEGTDRLAEKHPAIVSILQDDARATNDEIAERVNLSPSPCLRRIRNLEKSGVQRGYRADIDRNEVGLGLTVFVETCRRRNPLPAGLSFFRRVRNRPAPACRACGRFRSSDVPS